MFHAVKRFIFSKRLLPGMYESTLKKKIVSEIEDFCLKEEFTPHHFLFKVGN